MSRAKCMPEALELLAPLEDSGFLLRPAGQCVLLTLGSVAAYVTASGICEASDPVAYALQSFRVQAGRRVVVASPN